MNAATSECRSRLEPFLRRELSNFEGLAENCPLQALAQWLPFLPGEGLVHFGSEAVEFRFRMAEVAGFGEPLQFCFREGLLALVRTGLWFADEGESSHLLKELGEPSARLAFMFGTGKLPEGEWLYPARGLALGLIPETGRICSLSAFRPCSLSEYKRCFYNDEPAREF